MFNRINIKRNSGGRCYMFFEYDITENDRACCDIALYYSDEMEKIVAIVRDLPDDLDFSLKLKLVTSFCDNYNFEFSNVVWIECRQTNEMEQCSLVEFDIDDKKLTGLRKQPMRTSRVKDIMANSKLMQI